MAAPASGPSGPVAGPERPRPNTASAAEGSVYRPHERTSRLRFRTVPLSVSLAVLGGLSLLLPLVAFGWPLKAPSYPGLPSGSEGAYASAVLLFLVPGLLGSALTGPIASGLGGKLRSRRSFQLGFAGLLIVLLMLLLWRLVSAVLGPYPVEGPLLLAFGLTLWLRELALVALSHRSHARSLPSALSFPLLGMLLTFWLLGTSATSLGEAALFLLLPLGGAGALVRATDRPLSREFGQGAVGLLRPLMEHMGDRDPSSSARMEAFFDGISTTGDLDVGVLAFRSQGRVKLALVAPSVHPGPFAQLGSSDLPARMGDALRKGHAEEVMVPHAPSTHAQDIPTRAEVLRVVGAAEELIAAAAAGPSRCSPLVTPSEGSCARAMVLGDSVLVLITRAPQPTDDIDYALGEMVREEGRRLGFAHVIVVDAHNSFQENRGDVPFGSPEGFRLLADARAAMQSARDRTTEGGIRMGFARRTGFNPEDDGMGSEGLSVVVLEAAGTRTAFALFDANNLLLGLRGPIQAALEQTVGGAAEVLTTDNHVVHEVSGGTNTLGERRKLARLEADVREVGKEALARLAPVTVGASESKVRSVHVLGPGVITRLMTALADSFALFWLFFLASFVLAALAGALVLAFLR